MVLEELETGLFLDLVIQSYVEKVTVQPLQNFLVITELQEEYLKYFSLLAHSSSCYLTKTLYNPPFKNILNGTSTGTGADILVPEIGTVVYKLSFFKKDQMFVRCKNLTNATETYFFLRKDLDHWNVLLNDIKKKYY